MELSEIVSITGMPGLYKASGKRSDGLIATSLTDGVTKFVSGRQHLFSTLDNITVYTQEDTRELRLILAEIKKQEKKNPVPDTKDDAKVKAFFEIIVPDYDREKVYVSDMKKLIKWYQILDAKGLIEELTSEKKAEEGATEEKAEKVEVKEAKPKKESKPKADKSVTKAKPMAKPSGAVKKITTPRKAS